MKPNGTGSAGTQPVGTGRRFRDVASLLPALGVLLLMTPVVSFWATAGPVFGLPAAIVYIFGVWAGLILLAYGLARRARTRHLG